MAIFICLFTNKGGKLKTPSRHNSIKQKDNFFNWNTAKSLHSVCPCKLCGLFMVKYAVNSNCYACYNSWKVTPYNQGGKRYLLSKLLLSNEATMYVVLHGQRTCRRVIIPRTKGVSMSHVVEHWGVALTLTTILFSTMEVRDKAFHTQRFFEALFTLVSHIAITVEQQDHKFPFCGFELLLS